MFSCDLSLSGRGLWLGLALLSLPVHAESDPFLQCAVIAEDVQRLACYDALADVVGESGPKLEPPATATLPPPEQASAVEERILQSEAASRNWFAMTPYRPNYFLPLTMNSSPNNAHIDSTGGEPGIDHAEAKFQLSLEFDIWRKMFELPIDLYAAYTQVAWWQLYNTDDSSPFREVDYEPELGVILHPDLDLLGFHSRQMRVGVVHQSNGRSEPLSRSWNRVYATFMVDKGNFASALRLWARIPEDADQDDNPDIEDYLGHFELYGFYKWKQQTFSVMLRNNLKQDHNHGAIQLDWSHPISDRLKFYVQYFNGYGESLLDYDDSTNRLGMGLMLTDWL